MKSSIILAVLISTVTAYTPFRLSSLNSHQPAGAGAGGQVNYWSLVFDVNSSNSGDRSAYCVKSWSDNCNPLECDTVHVWSDNVPANQWIQCYESKAIFTASGEANSPFSFQLFPYFEIGNFSLEVRESLDDGSSLFGQTCFSNTTEAMTCDIHPSANYYASTHASGDCRIADGYEPVEVFVSTVDSSM